MIKKSVTYSKRIYQGGTLNNQRMIKITLEQAENLKADSDRPARLKEQECKCCFYIKGSLGLAVVTETRCAICTTRIVSENSLVDKLCPACAIEHGLCKHCGSDLEDKVRKKVTF